MIARNEKMKMKKSHRPLKIVVFISPLFWVPPLIFLKISPPTFFIPPIQKGDMKLWISHSWENVIMDVDGQSQMNS